MDVAPPLGRSARPVSWALDSEGAGETFGMVMADGDRNGLVAHRTLQHAAEAGHPLPVDRRGRCGGRHRDPGHNRVVVLLRGDEDSPSDRPTVGGCDQHAGAAGWRRASVLRPWTGRPDRFDSLAARLDRLWSDTPSGCIAVVSGDVTIYEAQADAAVAPASVAKLLTAVAARDVLGDSTRFTTTAIAAAPAVDGVVPGDLWLVGGGDPVLGTAAWAANLTGGPPLFTSLDSLADGVVASGVRHIAGRIVGDDSRYDARPSVDTWPRRFIQDGEVGPLSALSVNDGFRVWGHPGVPFAHPATGAAEVFSGLLRARGVVIEREAANGIAEGATVLAEVRSAPISDLLAAMLRYSDNGTAELLVKELGLRRAGEGSTEAGARVVMDALRRRGLPVGSSVVADGSGLSGATRVSCRLLASLLVSAEPTLGHNLAIAGQSGTLARRHRGTPVAGRLRAKTGSFDGVGAVAGYADTLDGETLAFAYVINGLARGSSGRSLQDTLASALVSG